MRLSRNIRRCAIQALYQFDSGAGDVPDIVRASLAESPGDEQDHQSGFDLATLVWAAKAIADEQIASLTPEWPLHRQPALDRNILRLAHYEITSSMSPPKVAIDEAVELAREFSTERSPAFINGVLDRVYHQFAASNLEAPSA